MDTQPLPLASLSLTHVTYNPADKLSYLSAWLALVPQGLVVVYVTLMWASREFEICAMFAGQMACEGLNFVLKRWIREERPAEIIGKGYGMPSSHAQFVSFFSLHLTLFLIFRHQPQRHHATHRPSNLFERIALSILSLICAAAVAASRVYLNYHTPRQVLVGVGAGSGFAIVWFGFTTYLRWSGWLEWMLELDVLRKLRVRDLLLQEDLQDAGWGRWEARRESRRRGAAAAAAVANGGGGSKLKAR